jgi:hypothetical protein
MGSKERRVIITFPRETLETTIFRDPRERPPDRRQHDQYLDFYLNGFQPFPTPQRLRREKILALDDEDHLRRLYAAAVFFLQSPTARRGLTRD